jgi:hypothetical protein
MENNLLIKLPFHVNEEVFYLKDEKLKKGKVYQVDAEVTEIETKFRIWFNKNNNCEVVRGTNVFSTEEEAIKHLKSEL